MGSEPFEPLSQELKYASTKPQAPTSPQNQQVGNSDSRITRFPMTTSVYIGPQDHLSERSSVVVKVNDVVKPTKPVEKAATELSTSVGILASSYVRHEQPLKPTTETFITKAEPLSPVAADIKTASSP